MNLLTAVLFLPLAGFLIALTIPRSSPQARRVWALALSLAVFVASLGLLAWFDRGRAAEQFTVDIQWINSPDIHFHIAADGVSLWLALLSTFLTPICVLISWRSIQNRVKEFYAFLLLLELGLIGVFLAQDLFLFYVFWEVSLVPMYFLIGVCVFQFFQQVEGVHAGFEFVHRATIADEFRQVFHFSIGKGNGEPHHAYVPATPAFHFPGEVEIVINILWI